MKSFVRYLLLKPALIRTKLAEIHADPKKVALGYALGIFLAASPFIGLKIFIAVPLTFIFKWNKLAAIIGIFHINPITGPLYYGFSFVVGKSILGTGVSYNFSWPITIKTFYELVTSNLAVFKCLLTGGFIIGLPLSLAAYFFSVSFINRKTHLKPNAL